MIASTGKSIFEYKLKHDKWDHVEITKGGLDGVVVGCEFQDMVLLIFTNSYILPHASLLKTNDGNLDVPDVPSETKNCLEGNGIFVEKNRLCHQIFCSTPIPITLCHCSVSIAGDDEIIVIGDHVSGAPKAFIGKLTRNKRDFKWKCISSMKLARVGPIMFKLGGDVYVAGGEAYIPLQPFAIARCTKLKSCEQYNLKKQKWSESEYCLPYPLSHASVVVSDNETFAVISGGLKENSEGEFKWTKIGKPSDEIILFTKENGFEVIENALLQRKRWAHVSMMLPTNNKT